MRESFRLDFSKRLQELNEIDWRLVQVVLGPRQVGKTTGVLQFLETLPGASYRYVSADGEISRHASWLEEQWLTLRTQDPTGLLIIDEIQKVENWSETVKKLWDRQKRDRAQLKVLLLGSSSLGIQKGLSESLTGRFNLHFVHHWNASESRQAYDLSAEDFLRFGGYPAGYAFKQDVAGWLSYVKTSIIDTVIGKDILQLARVKSPALFRQCFNLACDYGGQEISYTKLLGQLQERGNVEVVKHYLELFEGAYLLKQLFKYSEKKIVARASSPKILPLCPALYSVGLDGQLSAEDRGRAFEIAVGAELARLPGSLYYWRERDYEVDFIHRYGRRVTAIEVKSGRAKSSRGLVKFAELHPKARCLIFTPENFEAGMQGLRSEINS